MTITITDPKLLAQLSAATGAVQLRGPAGELLIEGHSPKYGKLPPDFVVPFTDDELEQFSRNREGRPWADIMRDLEARE